MTDRAPYPQADDRQWAELARAKDTGTSTALYALVDEFRTAADKLADLDLPEEVIADTLDGLKGALELKATNIAKFVQNLEASATAIKDAEARMKERRTAIERRAARIREYLRVCMVNAEISKIECPYFIIALRQNPPAVEVEDAKLVPAQYWRQKPPPPPELDKASIRDAIKAGEAVPGARLVQGNRVEIK